MNLLKKTLFLLLFFYFTFTFTFESINTIQKIFVYLISTSIVMLNFKFLKNKLSIKDKYLKLSFICYLVILLFSSILPILYTTFDFSYFTYVLVFTKIVVKNIFLLVIFLKIYRNKSSFYLYAKYYIMSCCIYIGITIIMMAVPSFKDFWLSIIHIDPYEQMLTINEQYISRIGVQGFAGFQQTFMCSVGVILNTYMIIFNNSRFKKNHFQIYMSLFMLIIGTLFYGRIGSIISFIALVILIMYYLTKIRNIKRALAIIGLIMILFSSLTYIAKDNEKVDTWLNWAFDYVDNYKNTGTLSNESADYLFDHMYFMPETKTLLIGDGYFTDKVSGYYYKSTDVGFMRNILFYGVFLTTIGYLTIIFILIGFKKRCSENKNKAGLVLFMLFFIQIIMFELKGGIHFVMSATLLPLYLLLLYDYKYNVTFTPNNNIKVN